MEEFLIRNLADIQAIEKVPLSERFSEKSTYEAIKKGSAVNPDAVAINFILTGDQYQNPIPITFRTLIGRINQAANCFHDLGIGPTDVVTYLLPNVPQTHYVLWGAEAAGIANPVNPLLEASAIRDICRAAGTKVLVALGEVPGSDIWKKVSAIKDDIPTLKSILVLLGQTDKEKGIFNLDEKLAEYPEDRLTFTRDIKPDDIASLYHTGGTTGTPKLARRTHYNELSNAFVMGLAANVTPDYVVMCGLPLFHANGTIVTGLAPLRLGAQIVLLTPQGYRDPGVLPNFFKIIEKFRPTFFSCVPTILSVLLETPKGNADISSLRYAVCGAAPLSVELFRRFEEYSGMKILEGYGLTESAAGAAANPKDGERRVGSIGLRLPYEEMKVVILDDEGAYERDAEPGEIGVIVLRGPNIFLGYVEEIHNKGLWIADGWFNTGDLGRMDAEGYFWLTGRKKELIIRGGHNIDPASIEEPIYRMSQVKAVAAVGRPDAHAGEVPVAYVELREAGSVTSQQVLEFAVREITERAAVPKEVYIVDALPLTPIGKIHKPTLVLDAARRVYEKEMEGVSDLASSVTVAVVDDKTSGKIAIITVAPKPGIDGDAVKKRIDDILARYTLGYTVVMA